MLDPAFGYLIIAAMALLFAGASVHKALGLARFAEIFAAYHVLPSAWARRLAWLIPSVEAAIALGLMWQPSRRAALFGGIVTLLSYALGLSINLLRGRLDLDCGCGMARERRKIAAWMVWRTAFLVAVLAVAALPWQSRLLSPTDVITVMGGLIVSVTLYVAVDRLLGVVAPQSMILRSTS
jgi:hypothetical protein